MGTLSKEHKQGVFTGSLLVFLAHVCLSMLHNLVLMSEPQGDQDTGMWLAKDEKAEKIYRERSIARSRDCGEGGGLCGCGIWESSPMKIWCYLTKKLYIFK